MNTVTHNSLNLHDKQRIRRPRQRLTFVFVQKVDALLQNSGLVHLAGVARQHGAQLLDEYIELVSAFLLGLVAGHTVGLDTVR